MKTSSHQADLIASDTATGLAVTQAEVTQLGSAARWRPCINAYRCNGCFIVCVDLAGVDPHTIEVTADARHLTIRGARPIVEPACGEPQPLQMLALEIEDGPFERLLELPDDADPGSLHVENRSGLLWVQLSLRQA